MIPPSSQDYRCFVEAGDYVLSGRNPYDIQAVAYPPTSFPIFALFAALPRAYSAKIWMVVNVVAAILLVPLARIALAAQDRDSRSVLPEPSVWALAAIVSLSIPVHFAMNLGQLAIFVAFCLLAALYCQAQRQAVLAGIFLAFATVKVHTLIPILILFLRKSDLRTWISLAVTTTLLCLSTSSISEFPGRMLDEFRNVTELSAAGKVNDYSFDNPYDHMIIGFDRTLYCLGLRDRSVIRWAQVMILVAIAAWLACLALRPRRFPRKALCAMVALYAMIFFYHRTYDMTILALPLVYAATGMKADRLLERWLSFALFIMIILLMYVHSMLAKLAVQKVMEFQPVLGYLGQAILLPYATWLILLSMASIALGAAQVVSETLAPNEKGHPNGDLSQPSLIPGAELS
jgi:hypothetical protein